jgi:hypothetical protein
VLIYTNAFTLKKSGGLRVAQQKYFLQKLMESAVSGIYTLKCIMKKTFGILSLLLTASLAVNAQKDDPPPPPPPPAPPKVDVTKFTPPVITKETDPFFTRNPSVSAIRWQKTVAIVVKKDNTQERYDLSKEAEKKAFNDKYGEAPAMPPPPPPKPPKVKQPPPPPPAPPKVV